jgi:hypothetical protein
MVDLLQHAAICFSAYIVLFNTGASCGSQKAAECILHGEPAG